jgi:DNA-binding MarR family transcriptional regulator
MADLPKQTVEAAVAGLFGNPAVESVLAEASALFHRMRHDIECLHAQGQVSSGRRSVMRGLAKLGRQTVPEMARARPVARQYMQRIVNELTDDGLVESVENPAHKRSSLIQLTAKGKRQLDEMTAREQELLSGLQVKATKEELMQAAETLRRIRELFESKEWRRRLASVEENES